MNIFSQSTQPTAAERRAEYANHLLEQILTEVKKPTAPELKNVSVTIDGSKIRESLANRNRSNPGAPRCDRDRPEGVGHIDAVGDDSAGGREPHRAGPFTEVKPDATLLLERSVDFLEQILQLALTAFHDDRARRAGNKHCDLGHDDSSSPLTEGASTPGDDSVEREASAAPSHSPEGAAREAGEDR